MLRRLFLVLILSVAASTASFGAITVTVYGSIAPDGKVPGESPYFQSYLQNATWAIYTGGAANVGLPSDYYIFSSASATGGYGVSAGVQQLIGIEYATLTDQTFDGSPGIPSWYGSANPSGDYGADFAAETGNQVMWGVSIISSLETFTLSGVLYSGTFAGQVTDSSTPMSNYIGDFSGPQILGFGPGGCYGTAWSCQNGDASTVLTELYFAGFGDAARISFDPDRALTAQDLADWIRDIGSVEASGAYQVVPEPSSFVLIGLGLAAAGLRFRRRK